MKHTLPASLITLATVALRATAAVVDYSSGTAISSSGYYQYHTKWFTTTCYETMTKTKDCSYGGDYDLPADYKTVSPEVYHPGPDYSDYKTIYETVYETAYPYPYEPSPYGTALPYATALPYPGESACYPETVYETVYADASSIYHTFTPSGTASEDPVYHTSTIMSTVTSTPSGSAGGECSLGSAIVNPGFDQDPWAGVWFPTGPVDRAASEEAVEGSWAAAVTFNAGGQTEAWLQQAIIIPTNTDITIGFDVRRTVGPEGDSGNIEMVLNLGSYGEGTVTFPPLPLHRWRYITVPLGSVEGPPGCVPVILSFKATIENGGDINRVFHVDSFRIVQ